MHKWKRRANAIGEKHMELEHALLCKLRGVEPHGISAIYADASLETLRIMGEVKLTSVTTDWPLLVADVAQKRLLDFYRDANPTYARLTRAIELKDFRPHVMLRPGDLTLRLKTQGAVIEEGSIADGGEVVSLLTFARLFSVSSTVFANDDVGLLDERVRIGAEAAVFAESAHFFEVLASNPVLSDGVAYFDASRNNIGSAGALDATRVGEAMALMRAQTAPGGGKLNLRPSFLLCGPESGPLALAAVKALTPGSTPILEVLVDAHIEDEAFYVFASPTTRPAFVAGRLRGWTGPQVDVQRQFALDGVAWRVITRIGVAPYDPRAAVRCPGA
jgi:hypothetical protein